MSLVFFRNRKDTHRITNERKGPPLKKSKKVPRFTAFMRTRELAKEFAITQISDGEWVDYFSVVKWVEDEAVRQGIEGKGAKQSINLLTVDSISRSSRGEKWNNKVLENPSSVDIFISNGEINTRGKKGCKLRRYQIGDTPYVKIG